MKYSEKLLKRIEVTGSGLCVGLDPRPELTEGGVEGIPEFLKKVVGETAEYAAAFKPNMAYFEALGLAGIEMLDELLREVMPKEVPVILDAKRSDIGETQKYYARSYFEHWGVDAVTLNPFLGYDTLEPFLGYEGKGIYLLGVTSNKGTTDFQQQSLGDGRKVYELVGDLCRRSQEEGSATDAGLVVGLTNAGEEVLAKMPDVPLLIPGLGAQGGDLSALKGSGRTSPNVVNVSRGISYGEGEYAALAKKWADEIAAAMF